MYFLYKKFLFETNRNMLKLFIINKKFILYFIELYTQRPIEGNAFRLKLLC